MLSWSEDIGLDLGTASVLIYLRGAGIVLRAPSVVAFERATGRLLAAGEEARQMLGRAPAHIGVTRPLKSGVIADYDLTEKMLRYFLSKVTRPRLLARPRVVVCIPTGVTGVEERAVRQAALQAGARQAFLIEEPLAAALGAGLPISEPTGSMVVDIGGGTTSVAVLSLGGIVCSRCLRVGGDEFDAAIVRYMRKEYNLVIGEATAEEVKIRVGTASPEGRPEAEFGVKGRDLVSGLPRTVRVTGEDGYRALQEPLAQVVAAVKEVLERTPPELAADIGNRGIVLTGGGSLLHGLDVLLSRETGLKVLVAPDPVSCVALGTGKALEMLRFLRTRGRLRRAL